MCRDFSFKNCMDLQKSFEVLTDRSVDRRINYLKDVLLINTVLRIWQY